MKSNRIAGFVLGLLLLMCAFLGWRIWILTQGEFADAPQFAPPPPGDDGATEAFMEAWLRNEDSEYIVFAQVGLRGNGLSAFTEDIIVQHNRQRLINRDSSIIYERDGATETCRQTPQDLFCTPAVDIDSAAERRADLEALLFGDGWSYRVRFAPNSCFTLNLDLSKGNLVPDYGLDSTYCYDAETGALASRVVRRVNRTETFNATEIGEVPPREDLDGIFPAPILDLFYR